jgi:hypothetical protein
LTSGMPNPTFRSHAAAPERGHTQFRELSV